MNICISGVFSSTQYSLLLVKDTNGYSTDDQAVTASDNVLRATWQISQVYPSKPKWWGYLKLLCNTVCHSLETNNIFRFMHCFATIYTCYGLNLYLLYILPMQSVPITTNIVSSKPVHVEVYWIQHVIKFVSDLQQVCGFLWVLRFPPPIKLTAII